MDIGTILLIAVVVIGVLDAIILLLGPRIKEYENYSFIASAIGFLISLGTIIWLGFLIFSNQFQYDYIYMTTEIDADILLKISALWAGQSGSLIFWTFLSFGLYFGFRVASRGYEDDKLVYRAAIIMVVESVLIAINALIADPFRVTTEIARTDGLGLNPLLSTIWNVIHPPIIFIGYALTLVPFAVMLAGFTLSSEDRNQDPIPVVSSYVRFTTISSWLTLSAGIAIGGYWAYLVLGWGGYWAWDPVETTSLIPWLLVTAYYTSVHGFGLSPVSWSMLINLLFNLTIGVSLALYSGFRDMTDEEEKSDGPGFFDTSNIRLFSIKIALIGLIIVAGTSIIGVALPATYNLGIAIGATLEAFFAGEVLPRTLEGLIGINVEFFRIGFYLACVFLIASAFYCMRTSFLTHRRRGFLLLTVFGVGGVLAALTVFGGLGPVPTNYWPANFLIIPAAAAIGFLVIAFILQMAGKEKIGSTRQVGRLMLHLGLIILLLGVFMSENVVYETNSGYLTSTIQEVAPDVYIRVADINPQYINSVDPPDFNLIVTINVLQNTTSGWIITGIGYATVTGHPEWGMVSHHVYLDSTAFRDVFIAVTGFSLIAPGTYQVTIHTKILPLISFVWIGVFLMVSSMLPIFGMEIQSFMKALRGKEEHLYADETEIAEGQEAKIDGN
jgi:cytochrome c biogenesis factor